MIDKMKDMIGRKLVDGVRVPSVNEYGAIKSSEKVRSDEERPSHNSGTSGAGVSLEHASGTRTKDGRDGLTARIIATISSAQTSSSEKVYGYSWGP